MTLSKVSPIPPVIKLKDLKIFQDEILIIEEQINEDWIVKKENISLIILQNVDRKYK